MLRSALLAFIVVLAALVLGCSGGSPDGSTPAPTRTPEKRPPTSTPSGSPSESPSASASPAQDHHKFLQDGMDLALRKKYAEAVPELEKAEAIAPNDPEVHLWLFISYQGTETAPTRQSKAYLHAQKVLELMPGTAQANRAREFLNMVEAMEKTPRGNGKRPADVAGFDKARLGMTEEELKAALGGDLKPFSGPYMNPRHSVHYCMQRYLAGKPYNVLFPMSNETGKLAGIYIRPLEYPGGDRAEFEALQKYLTELYGPPDGSDDLNGELASRLRTVWKFKSATVHLNLYGEGDLSVTSLRPEEPEQ